METIWITYGRDYKQMAIDIARAAGLSDRIGDPAAKIGLKPNLVTASPASHGATTHPELVAGLIEYLQDAGFRNLQILEGAWVGASTRQAFSACGYRALSERYGVPLHDTKEDKGVSRDCGGMALSLCESALSLDFLINLPVIKGHCQTSVTCALKNLKGLIPDKEKRRFHTMGLHKPIAHLNAGIRAGFVLADGICGDLDFEEGGNPVPRDLVAGCYDPVLLDTFAADSMGYAAEEIDYLPIAESLGLGSTRLAKAKQNILRQPEANRGFHASGRVGQLAGYAKPLDACSACYSNLIYALQRMRERRTLRGLSSPIAIGQGYAGSSGAALGVGKCAAGCERSLSGCPPSAARILAFLENET